MNGPPPRSTLFPYTPLFRSRGAPRLRRLAEQPGEAVLGDGPARRGRAALPEGDGDSPRDRKSTRLNSSHANISYAVFCLKKKKDTSHITVVTDRTHRLPAQM